MMEPPELALVILPCASIKMLALLYEPAVTPVFVSAMVPVVVIGPPVSPVPLPTLETVPPLPAGTCHVLSPRRNCVVGEVTVDSALDAFVNLPLASTVISAIL